ncbi:MAG: crotonase/enoyl-CoA hydratase family protein [Candidatus Rokubacteria bacterium]|nr:crotonase/enoyl-CoA hydratase family protein [Candidatus Rokubacteria bacterium]
MTTSTVLYERTGRIAHITLNRPECLNAINDAMPADLSAAVAEANRDASVHVIVLAGAGRAFCAGYDLKLYAESPRPHAYSQEMPWDPMIDYSGMRRNTECFMSLWRSFKPVICQVHGYAVGGGSDLALSADIVIMAEDAKIGYPPARVWGCPTTAMWLYRVGAERAKRLLLTGDLISGSEANRIGLVSDAVPAADLTGAVERLAARMASVPTNQLMMQKLMINQAYENMGLATSQLIATVFDGIARHTPEGLAFKARAQALGFKRAVQERDSGDPIPGA